MAEKPKNRKLNKPFRTPKGPKKFAVYVKDPKTGNIKIVRFGDPNMEIKRDDLNGGITTVKNCHTRVGCSQIDSDDFSHFLSPLNCL